MKHIIIFDYYNGLFYDYIARHILEAERIAEINLGNCCVQGYIPGDPEIELMCGVWNKNLDNTRRVA